MLIQSNNPDNEAGSLRVEIERFNEVGAALVPCCYITLDSNIDVVCHHCGRPMSMADKHYRRDTPYRQKLSRRYRYIKKPADEKPRWRKFLAALQDKLLLKNQEFTKLDLKIDMPIHCEDCNHYIGTSRWLVALVVFCLILFTMLLLGQRVSLMIYFVLLELLAFVSLLLFYFNYTSNQKKLLRMGIPFPITGRALSSHVKEELTGQVTLDENGGYTADTDLSQCKGTITNTLQITSTDIERLEKFKNKFKQHMHSKIYYQFGFLLFQNIRAVQFQKENLHLFGQKLKPLLVMDQGIPAHWAQQNLPFEQEVVQTYDVVFVENDARNKTPIQIFPTIISEGDKTGLELTVQLNPDIWSKHLLNTEVTIQELNVNIAEPETVGFVQTASPPHQLTGVPNQVCWKKAKLAHPVEKLLYESLVDSDDVESHLQKLMPTRQFYVRFESDIEKEMKLTGSLVAEVKGTFSGIEKLQFFDSLGYKMDEEEFTQKQKSEITINFDLALNSLCVRKYYAPRINLIKRDKVIPDHRIVNALIKDLISDDTTYIQRVVENPSQTNQANAKIQNCFWDISGRHYNGVYPVDFHIVLSGQQEYIDKDIPDKGNVIFDVSVYGTVTSDEMEKEVDGVKKRLINLITNESYRIRNR